MISDPIGGIADVTKDISERLEKRTQRNASTGCLEWVGPVHDGYGRLSIANILHRVHRLSWELHRGAIPDGLSVLHRCDNRRCIEIEHLFLGTSQENTADMIAKGRKVVLRGELHPLARLTSISVRVIRRLSERGMGHRELGEIFMVNETAIHKIVNRLRWKTVA